MNVTVAGIGVWMRGIAHWDAFTAACAGDFDGLAEAELVNPRPEAVAARERRRAGLTINLAVEVTHQACDMAGADKSLVASVFTSAMGDTDVTDYMCRKLATEEKLLSPTRFHNSVHNATSGYWSISAGNRAPSSFVGGFRDSFAAGLLEAACCGAAEDLPVVVTGYDVANQAPFGDVLPIDQTVGLALLLTPGAGGGGWSMSLDVEAGAGHRAEPARAGLRQLAGTNPMSAGLALLEALADDQPRELAWPVGAGTRLRVAVQPRVSVSRAVP